MGLESCFILWLLLVLSLNSSVFVIWVLLTIVAIRNSSEVQMKLDELWDKARKWVNEKEKGKK